MLHLEKAFGILTNSFYGGALKNMNTCKHSQILNYWPIYCLLIVHREAATVHPESDMKQKKKTDNQEPDYHLCLCLYFL